VVAITNGLHRILVLSRQSPFPCAKMYHCTFNRELSCQVSVQNVLANVNVVSDHKIQWVEVYLHSFFIWKPSMGGLSASRPGRFTSGGTTSVGYPLLRGWVGPRYGVDFLERTVSCPCQKSKTGSSSPWPSHYTYWATYSDVDNFTARFRVMTMAPQHKRSGAV
jgi:hypothetical protein